jgi:hypothetical protein
MGISRIALSSLKTLNKSDSFLDGNPPYIPSSFESIATVTAAGGETSLSFTSIPGTYSSLQIRGTYRDTYSGAGPSYEFTQGQFNGDTATNYSVHRLFGNGVTVSVGGTASLSYFYAGLGIDASALTNTFGGSIIDILDYASTTKYKTVRTFAGVDVNGAVSNIAVALFSSFWRSTAAITTITLKPTGTPAFAAGSTYALYGVK